MQYDDIADQLAGIADGTIEPDPATRAFIDSDLRAQAELARYRRILRTLESMRDVKHQPPAGLLTETLAGVHTTRQDPNTRAIVFASAVGGAALVAASATALLLARSRKHSRA